MQRKEVIDYEKTLAVILTIVAGYIGFRIDIANNMGGDFGVVFAIAAMGYFIIDAIEKK